MMTCSLQLAPKEGQGFQGAAAFELGAGGGVLRLEAAQLAADVDRHVDGADREALGWLGPGDASGRDGRVGARAGARRLGQGYRGLGRNGPVLVQEDRADAQRLLGSP